MKKRLLIFGASVAIALSALVSCIEDDNVSFTPSVNYYIVENQVDSTITFTPFFSVTSYVEEQKVRSFGVYHDYDQANLGVTKISEYSWETDGEIAYHSAAEINGYYSVAAQASDGKTFSENYRINIDDADTIGAIVCRDFSFDEHGRTLKATVYKKSIDIGWGFVLTPYDVEGEPHRIANNYISRSDYQDNGDGTITFSYSLEYNSVLIPTERALIGVYAANSSSVCRDIPLFTLQIDVNTQKMNVIEK